MSYILYFADSKAIFQLADGSFFKLGETVFSPSFCGNERVTVLDTSGPGWSILVGHQSGESIDIHYEPRLINMSSYLIDPHGRGFNRLYSTRSGALRVVLDHQQKEVEAIRSKLKSAEYELYLVQAEIQKADSTD
jgi:hypothetical protein